jgi:hypothetical protein
MGTSTTTHGGTMQLNALSFAKGAELNGGARVLNAVKILPSEKTR